MKTFLGKRIKDLTPGERYCYKLDKRYNRIGGFYGLRQILLHSVEKLCDLFVLLRQRIGLMYEKAASRSTTRFSGRPFRKHPKMSEKLQVFVYKNVYELAETFNSVLFAGKEYEIGFNEVMKILGVPTAERDVIGAGALVCAEMARIPYHTLSPLNQFIVTVYPYVRYCLENKLPDEKTLREEADTLLNDGAFPRYVQEKFGVKISQEVKGALWHPGI